MLHRTKASTPTHAASVQTVPIVTDSSPWVGVCSDLLDLLGATHFKAAGKLDRAATAGVRAPWLACIGIGLL